MFGIDRKTLGSLFHIKKAFKGGRHEKTENHSCKLSWKKRSRTCFSYEMTKGLRTMDARCMQLFQNIQKI